MKPNQTSPMIPVLRFLHAGLVMLWMCSCQTVKHEENVATAVRPKRLVAAIGGFLGASYRVVLNDDGSVNYLQNPRTLVSLPGTKRTSVHVSDEQWRHFREVLNQANIKGWKNQYIDRGVVDGTSWEIDVEYPDRTFKSQGLNAYPDSKSFDLFLSAVSELLGGKDFR